MRLSGYSKGNEKEGERKEERGRKEKRKKRQRGVAGRGEEEMKRSMQWLSLAGPALMAALCHTLCTPSWLNLHSSSPRETLVPHYKWGH